jgi:hypothetical protein
VDDEESHFPPQPLGHVMMGITLGMVWILDGSLGYEIDTLEGLNSIIEATSRVLHGRNRGVQLVRISPEAA